MDRLRIENSPSIDHGNELFRKRNISNIDVHQAAINLTESSPKEKILNQKLNHFSLLKKLKEKLQN